MFGYVTLQQRIPVDHPARQIRALVDRALERMDAEFEKLYSTTGRPSIAPERLLRATLLMVLYSIRSERQLMEQLDYNLLFRWFVGLEMDDAVWDVTVFTKNRERLIEGAVSQQLLEAVLVEARERQLLSEEHFTVDGTLIQAWAAALKMLDAVVTPRVSEYVKGNLDKNSLTETEKADPRRAISQRKRKLIERVFSWSKLDRPVRRSPSAACATRLRDGWRRNSSVNWSAARWSNGTATGICNSTLITRLWND